MPFLEDMGNPVFKGADVTKCIEVHESITFCTGTDPGAEDVFATNLEYYPDTIEEMIKLMNRYFRQYWERLNEELQDAFHHANS